MSEPSDLGCKHWLVVGEPASAEFIDGLRSVARRVRIRCVADIDAAAACDRRDVERLVRLQPRPAADPRPMERLAELFPGVECLEAVGVWCEGEQRTGKPPKGWRRVFWHEFDVQSATSPGTAAPDPRGPFDLAGRLVLIDCIDAETAEAIADTVAEHGGAATWSPCGRGLSTGASSGAWVGSQLGGGEAVRLDRFCRRFGSGDTPVVVLLDFPRPETVRAARRIGAAAVLGRPHTGEALAAALVRASGVRNPPVRETPVYETSASVNITSRRHSGS
ncbi:MAG: hypothetical protein ACRCT8_00810 [Lacipirellulaceae bacterium]